MTVFNTPKKGTIPVPERSIDSLLAVAVALKDAVEGLQGARGEVPVSRTYVSNTEPVGQNVGDLWIVTLPSFTMSYWTGTSWQLIIKAYPDGTLHAL